MKKKLLSLILALLMLTIGFTAVAEETNGDVPVRERGNYPERGIVIGLTEQDELDGMACAFNMGATQEISQLPLFDINYVDEETLEAVLKKYENSTEEDFADGDFLIQVMIDMFSASFNLYEIVLFETDYINEKKAGDGMLDAQTSVEDLTVLGENDGYTYVLFSNEENLKTEDAALQERLNAAFARATELIDTITYQPVVFAEGEITVAPDMFPAFEVQDLAGNTVTNDLFAGKDLTVVNIWGTFCNPCIEEMPELAAWSAAMPENVQIVGLVSDLNTADDADTLETAKAICEATGADVYTHLIAEEDFAGLLAGVVGVPTTLFVDGAGNLIAEPVVGANVPMCQKTVSDYLNTL